MIYGEQHRAIQQAFETTALADRVNELIVLPEISDEHKAFIESRDLFFLTTVDHRGYPTCSYKGGSPGFVKVIDNKTITFPSYDGNGMYLSIGNLSNNNKVGLLFIDFETPHRVRVHGQASIDQSGATLLDYPGAELLVHIKITEIFVNCPRYIHQYQRLNSSKYVPQVTGEPSSLPQWKRIDAIQDVLPDHDKKRVAQLGGTITGEEYATLVMTAKG